MANQNDRAPDASPLDPLPGSVPAALAHIGDAVRARLDATPAAQRVNLTTLDMYLVRGFATPAECAALTDLTDRDAQPSKKFAIGADPSIRTSHTCYLDPADTLVADIDRRIAEVLGIPQSHSEAIQAQRYAVGQEFKVHSDYF